MSSAPLAYTVHPGGRAPTGQEQQVLAQWLPANGINPNLVSAEHPITVLPIPLEGTGDGPWMIQVIVFQQIHVDHTGAADYNLIIGGKVAFQRTVPLRVPFPTAPATDGEDHGQAHRQAAQEAPEEGLRPAGQAGVSDPGQGARPGGPVEGETARNEGAAEEGPSCGDQAIPQPEEDGQQQEAEVTT